MTRCCVRLRSCRRKSSLLRSRPEQRRRQRYCNENPETAKLPWRLLLERIFKRIFSNARCTSRLDLDDASVDDGLWRKRCRPFCFQTGSVGSLQRDEINGPGLSGQAKTRERNGEVESAWASAAGIYVEYAVFFVLSGLMGMAEEDNVNSGSGRGEVEFVDVVNKVEGGRSGFD